LIGLPHLSNKGIHSSLLTFKNRFTQKELMSPIYDQRKLALRISTWRALARQAETQSFHMVYFIGCS
jgi:hypothetical protein